MENKKIIYTIVFVFLLALLIYQFNFTNTNVDTNNTNLSLNTTDTNIDVVDGLTTEEIEVELFIVENSIKELDELDDLEENSLEIYYK